MSFPILAFMLMFGSNLAKIGAAVEYSNRFPQILRNSTDIKVGRDSYQDHLSNKLRVIRVDGELNNLVDILTRRFRYEGDVSNFHRKTYRIPVIAQHPDHYKLIEMESNLITALEKHGYSAQTKHLQAQLKAIQYELTQTNPSYALTHRLANDLKFHMDIPEWFKELRLCYSYFSDREGRYCDGGEPVCGSLNEYTGAYHDWTRRAGGCHLSWGLFSSSLPAAEETKTEDVWFNYMQLCFTYIPFTGVSHPVHSLCAPLNKFTQFYHDNFSGIATVAMSWAIRIDAPPTLTIPTWMQFTKLCIRYSTLIKIFGMGRPSRYLTKCASWYGYGTPRFTDSTRFKSHFSYRESYIKWSLQNNF